MKNIKQKFVSVAKVGGIFFVVDYCNNAAVSGGLLGASDVEQFLGDNKDQYRLLNTINTTSTSQNMSSIRRQKKREQELLLSWRNESGHSMRKMGKMIGISASHISRVLNGEKTLSAAVKNRVKEVKRLEQIIRCNPVDVMLVKHELEELVEGY